MTIEELKQTDKYKEWVNDSEVEYIFKPYGDSDPYDAFIVISKMKKDSYIIYRFFPYFGGSKGEVKLQVSVDGQGMDVRTVFKKIVEDYTSELKI